ncbi:MAG: hypothetical protein GX275_08745 [Clostridiales bacterium]|nr:hypothetical protein [Clostridiales bacterium]
MRLYISTNNYDISQYPKELLVYCDDKLYATLDLTEKNVVDIEDSVSTVRVMCKSFSRKNNFHKFLFFLISIFSIIFGTNGTELLEYIFDDVIELKTSKKDLYINYIGKGNIPFSIKMNKESIIKNCRQVEKKTFIKWLFAVVIPIQIILFGVATILIISSKYIWFILIVLALLVGFEIYMLSKIRKVYFLVNNR